MKILLTGANGQLGREIQTHQPKDLGAQLISLTREECDIASLIEVKKSYDGYQPDLILNAAAYTAVDLAEQEPDEAYAANATGVQHLVSICKQANIPFIHLSTDYVFDGTKKNPYTENDITSPLNVYGKTKLEGEKIITNQLTQYIILRTSWVFGEHGKNFVKTILRLANQQKELRVVHDQIGCPTAAKNIAVAIWKIIKKIKYERDTTHWGIYHYANMPAVSWYEFSEAILKLKAHSVEKHIPITTNEYLTPAKRPKNSILDCKKIQDHFNITESRWHEALLDIIK